jgi:23S rRNA (cytidine1920-2'-O)/16S rRNA (cytidine1409-2'-O)-methyltransferase
MPEMTTKMRLDIALAERGLVSSRTRAQNLIKTGGVYVNGLLVEDPNSPITKRDKITLGKEDIPWVSRAGFKLESALTRWKIDPKKKVALDIGASTGGFTDVLLHHGVKKVYALDVGRDQLAEKLRKDARVVSMEKTHIEKVSAKDFKEKIGLITIDVSFISLEKVLPKAKELLTSGGTLIALVKPQFEVGKQFIKKGIVTDPTLHAKAVQQVEACAEMLGFEVKGLMASPILGGEGNKEFLLYAQRN